MTVALVPGRGSPDSHPQPHTQSAAAQMPSRPSLAARGEGCVRPAPGTGHLLLCSPQALRWPPRAPPLTLVPDVDQSLSEALDDRVTRMLSAFFNER